MEDQVQASLSFARYKIAVDVDIFVRKIKDKYYFCFFFSNLLSHTYQHRLFTLRAFASNLLTDVELVLKKWCNVLPRKSRPTGELKIQVRWQTIKLQIPAYFGLHAKLLLQTSRLISGSFLQRTKPFKRLRTCFGMAVMRSLLLHITFARDVFLISSSWQAVNAVLVVREEAFGSFSNQNRSPTLKRRNCSAMRHWNVGPNTPPFVDSLGGSSSPKNVKT